MLINVLHVVCVHTRISYVCFCVCVCVCVCVFYFYVKYNIINIDILY